MKRGMKDSVPRERKRMNMSSIDHSNEVRTLTPPRKDIQKYMKNINEKSEYLNTSNMNNSHIIPNKKELIESKDKNKLDKKETSSKPLKEEYDKQKKDKENDIKREVKTKELDLKKDKISDKKDKKDKKEEHNISAKYIKHEKEEKKNEKTKKEETKEEIKGKDSEREKLDNSKQRSYIFEKKDNKLDQSKQEKRMSCSVVPDNRNENRNEQSKKDRRTASTINTDGKEEKQINKKPDNRSELITKKDSKEEKRNDSKVTSNDNKRQSINKISNESQNNKDIKKEEIAKIKTEEEKSKSISQVNTDHNKYENIENNSLNTNYNDHLSSRDKNKDGNSGEIDRDRDSQPVKINDNDKDNNILKQDIIENHPVQIKMVKKSNSNEEKTELIETSIDQSIINTQTNEQKEQENLSVGPINLNNIKRNNKLNRFASLNFSSNFNKALFLTAFKNYLPFHTRIEMFSSIKNISLVKEDILNIILKEYQEKVNAQESIITKYENDFMVDNQVNKVFAPSKTASNGLNFITKEEENNLMKKEQQNEVLNIFRCIYIIINESYVGIPSNKLIENLIIGIFQRRKIENLKFLFFNTFPANLNTFTQIQHEKLLKLQQEYPKLLNSSDLLKMSRSVSYMTFILKEVFDYLNMKTSDGTLIYMIRTARKTNPLIKEKIDKLQIILNNN